MARRIHCDRCGDSAEVDSARDWKTLKSEDPSGNYTGTKIGDLCPACHRHIVREATKPLAVEAKN